MLSFRSQGNVAVTGRGQPLSKRFWAKVSKDGRLVRPELGPCWEWTASVTSAGYGQINAGERGHVRMLAAHRLSWEMHNGPVPTGEGFHGTCVLHRCDNRRCVRPDHLTIGSQADNLRDMSLKQRRSRKLTLSSVASLRRLRADGVGLRALSERFGVAVSTVSEVANNKRWRDAE